MQLVSNVAFVEQQTGSLSELRGCLKHTSQRICMPPTSYNKLKGPHLSGCHSGCYGISCCSPSRQYGESSASSASSCRFASCRNGRARLKTATLMDFMCVDFFAYRRASYLIASLVLLLNHCLTSTFSVGFMFLIPL